MKVDGLANGFGRDGEITIIIYLTLCTVQWSKEPYFFHSFKKKINGLLGPSSFSISREGARWKVLPPFLYQSGECPQLIGRTRAILMHGQTWSSNLQLKFEKCRELIRILVPWSFKTSYRYLHILFLEQFNFLMVTLKFLFLSQAVIM